MSVVAARQKLEQANLADIPWLNPELLQYNPTFLSLTAVELQVFVSWTTQQPELIDFLVSGSTTKLYSDSLKLSEHSQFEAYKAFITSLLFPALKEKVQFVQTHYDLLVALRLSVLLSDKEQDIIQDFGAVWLMKRHENVVQGISQARSDEAIYTVLNQELNKDFWQALNTFNARHYRVRTAWLELMIGTVSHRHASTRLLAHVITQLESVTLSPEHRSELDDLKKQLKKGKIVFDKTRIPWKTAVLICFIALLVVGGIIGIWFIPANPEEKLAQEETSFMELSQQDRNKIDSLISIVEQERVQQEKQAIDGTLPIPDVRLVERDVDGTSIFWDYYSSWKMQDSISYVSKFSTSKADKRRLKGTKSLSKSSGEIEIGFINSSNAMALIVLFDEFSGDTYSMFVASSDKVRFHCEEGMQLVVLSGSNPGKQLDPDHLPFKEINQYFFEQLENIYSINGSSLKMKLVLEKAYGNGTALIDLNSGLTL